MQVLFVTDLLFDSLRLRVGEGLVVHKRRQPALQVGHSRRMLALLRCKLTAQSANLLSCLCHSR